MSAIKGPLHFALLWPLLWGGSAGCLGRGCSAALSRSGPPAFAVYVQVDGPGLSAEQIEREDTAVIENSLSKLPGLRRIRSRSMAGRSTIRLDFDRKTDPGEAMQAVRETLPLPQLPPGHRPELERRAFSPVFRYTLTGKGLTGVELQRIQERALAPAMLPVSGVAEVVTCGGAVQRVEVQADPARLVHVGASLDELFTALNRPDRLETTPGAAALGLPSTASHRSLTALSELLIGTHQGAPVLVRDVASVAMGSRPRDCLAMEDERDDVLVGQVRLMAGADPKAAFAALRAALVAQAGQLPVGAQLHAFDDGESAHLRVYVRLRPPPAPAAADDRQILAALRDAARGAPGVRSVLALAARRASAPEELALIVAFAEPDGGPAARRAPGDAIAALMTRLDAAPGMPPIIDLSADEVARDRELRRWHSVGLRILGTDYAAMALLAQQVRDRLIGQTGIRAISIDGNQEVTQTSVVLNRERLAELGWNPGSFTVAAQALMGGAAAGSIRCDAEQLAVVLRLPAGPAADVEALGAALIPVRGALMAVNALASVRAEPARTVITRDGRRRRMKLRLIAPSREPQSVLKEGQARLTGLPVPSGIAVEWDSEPDDPAGTTALLDLSE